MTVNRLLQLVVAFLLLAFVVACAGATQSPAVPTAAQGCAPLDLDTHQVPIPPMQGSIPTASGWLLSTVTGGDPTWQTGPRGNETALIVMMTSPEPPDPLLSIWSVEAPTTATFADGISRPASVVSNELDGVERRGIIVTYEVQGQMMHVLARTVATCFDARLDQLRTLLGRVETPLPPR